VAREPGQALLDSHTFLTMLTWRPSVSR